MHINKRKSIGIIGGSLNSAVGRAHYHALQLDGLFHISSGCFSRNDEINNATAVRYGVDENRVYKDLEEFIKHEKKNIDAVLILTPTDQHYCQVINCLENNIPVICEKSLACSTTELSKIEKSIQTHKGFLTVIYNYLGYPMVRELKNMVTNNEFGRVHQVNIEMPQESFIRVHNNNAPMTPQEWRLKDGVVPTVSLDLAVHMHILLKYIISKRPLSVVSSYKTSGNFVDIIDNVNAMINYEDDIICNFRLSKTSLGYRNGLSVEIFGDKKSCKWVQTDPELLHIADKYGNKTIFDRGNNNSLIAKEERYERFKAGHPTGFIEALSNYYLDIRKSLDNYQEGYKTEYLNEEVFGLEASKEAISLFESMTQSSRLEKWVTIQK